MDSDDGGPFALGQPLPDGSGYPASSGGLAGQYHMWVAAASSGAPASTTTTPTNSSNNTNTPSLPTHFSPVSPSGHGMYSDHLSLHPAQSSVDVLSVRLAQGDYNHTTSADRLGEDGYHGAGGQGEGYHGAGGSDSSARHQANYHDHLMSQDRHVAVDTYHHMSASSSSSSGQQQDRLTQGDYHSSHQGERLGAMDYHSGQQGDTLGAMDYHSGQQGDRLAQGDYHSAQQSTRLGQADYHLDQPADRLAQSDYHAAQQQSRLGQSEYHSGQQSDRLTQSDYHVSPQPDRLGQLDYHSSGQSERLTGLSKQDYHALGGNRLGQQTGQYHSGQTGDRGLAAQPDYHATQVELDAVGMHADFERRHLDVSMLPKDLVDSGQRGSAMDYLTSSRDYLASCLGLPRELDLSVGQTVSPPQRSAPSDLASSSHGLDTATLPRDFSPYSQRDLDRAMMSASDVVVGQLGEGGGRTSGGAAPSVGLHPQDLAGINMAAAPRDLVDMTSFTRASSGHDDMGRGRDVLHRPRDVQRALEDLGSLDGGTVSVDLTLNAGSGSKPSSRTYTTSRMTSSSAKRQNAATSQPTEIRTQNPLPVVPANGNGNAGVGFFPLPGTRDALSVLASEQQMGSASGGGVSSRHGGSADFSRQPTNELSRLRRELTAPYPDLSVHHSMLASSAAVPVATFKSAVEPLFNAHGDQLICNDALTSSRERLYEMMKQQQFCDAVIATTLHSIKVHKAVLCSASAYLCGVLSQTCMGKSGGRILTVQFKADIPASSLSAFIDFIYQGRIKLSLKGARDLNVMARCLHMESLKKTSEEMLMAMGLSNDLDLNIPELLLLETLVDKFDKACTASFPVPTPPPPSCDVGVATDSAFLNPPSVHEACQTDPAPVSCSCGGTSSGAIDLRSGGGSLRLGGLGILSLAVGCGGQGDVASVASSASSDTRVATTPAAVAKPHHKKHLASQASRVKAEADIALAATISLASSPSAVTFSSLTSPALTATAQGAVTFSSLTSPALTATAQGAESVLRVETDARCSSVPARSPTPTHRGVVGKARKRTSTPTSALSPSLPTHPSSQPPLPGQTARAIHHSYGTRAASRTPTRLVDPGTFPQLHGVSKSGHISESERVKQEAGDNGGDAQSQMAKHRGRTKKGRIAAALSEAFVKSSQAAEDFRALQGNGDDSERLCDPQTDGSRVSPSVLPHSMEGVATTCTAPSTTTALTEAKRSAPRAYRKRLIQSVVSSQSILARKQSLEDGGGGGGSVTWQHDVKEELGGHSHASTGGQGVGEGEEHWAAHTEHLREALHSPFTAKRKKKGKARRMLLSSQSNNGGVRVRAPPKKRAKMELEFEKLMREEMEEEDEEEEAAAIAGGIIQALEQGEAASSKGVEGSGQQQTATAGRRIKMPWTKPGKRPRWIKKDKLSSLLIELNQKAGSVTQSDCAYFCRLCDNQFLLPKRCLSHVMTTHKVPEAEVIDSILLRQRHDGETHAEETGVSENLVCDMCGYRSRDNTTYYLHYHKYFKHGIPLPKGWTAYTCDLCGKELYTKFQLKDHKRTHAEKTPFVCELCGAGFQSRSNLHSHVLHRHKEEKKHSCNGCDRTFKTRTQLAVHERTHTGVRPFSCPQCTYRSTTRGNMRLHLVNRHKMPNTVARDIMRDMRPDVDLSLKPLWQQVASDTGGEKKSSKRKPGGKQRKEREGEESQTEPAPNTEMVSYVGKQEMVMDPNTVELLLKTAAGEEQGGQETQQPSPHSSLVLNADTDGNVVTLQAAEAFPATHHAFPATGVCGETVTFLPPGLETVFQQQSSDISVATSMANSAATTIIVPENFLLHHSAQAFQQHHHKHHLYHQHHQPHFTSFVVGAAPTLQALTSTDLVVSATTLNSAGLKVENMNSGGGVVDLGDMGVGVMEGTLRQGGVGAEDGTLQPTDMAGVQQTESPATAQTSDQLYMQHSPISPAPPLSPQPVYVAVTPTHTPQAAGREGEEEAVGGGGAVLDQVQQHAPIHYDPNLLQAYYPTHFYSQTY
ncbi:uncharacterized protein [Littorina saxatilis]|uniref:uncharacterized protein isoform X2 n=1 Tax=Littorina saxatilis TaxID=31220 RepID=UPI0038B504B9